MSGFTLTPADVERLLSDTSDVARAETALKVSSDLEQNLTSAERKIAEDIIAILAKDAAALVRRTIAEQMKASRRLPAGVAEQLALDIEDISLPMLQNSPVLSDAFLVRVIRERGDAEQIAIAGRADLPSRVVETLVEEGREAAVETLLQNPKANLAEYHMAAALERFPQSDGIAEGIASRAQVPAHILEYLVNEASAAMRDKIRARPDFNVQMDGAVVEARESATLRMLGRARPDAELESVANQLIAGGRLTPSFLLRMLCMGDVRFFEICMALIAKLPIKNARALLHDQGAAGFHALYTRTGLDKNLLPAMRHALRLVEEMKYDGRAEDEIRYKKRLLERILTRPEGMNPADVEYLLEKLGDLGVSAPVA